MKTKTIKKRKRKTPRILIKRFNLWLPIALWRRLSKYVARRQRSTREVKIEPTGVIRAAIEVYLRGK